MKVVCFFNEVIFLYLYGKYSIVISHDIISKTYIERGQVVSTQPFTQTAGVQLSVLPVSTPPPHILS